MTQKSIIFDFDGTLVDSNHIKNDAFYEVVSEYKDACLHLQRILSKPHGDRYDVFRGLAVALNQTEQWGMEKAYRYTQRCERLVCEAPEIPGASDSLVRLSKSGYSMHINSATPEHTLVKIIAKRGWTHYFATVLGAPSSKEDNLRRVISKFDLNPDYIVMVGDGDNDRQAAATLNIDFIGIATPRENFTKPIEKWSVDLKGIEHLL